MAMCTIQQVSSTTHSGTIMFTFKEISHAEIDQLLYLTTSVGWHIASEDVRIMIDNPHSGALVSYQDTTPAGSGCWQGNDDGSVVFISLVTVHENFRRQGLATQIMHRIFELNPQATTFRLFASDMGKPVYEKLSFNTYTPVKFIYGSVANALKLGQPQNIQQLDKPADWMIDMDEQLVAPKRRQLLNYVFSRPDSVFLALPDKTGFAVGRLSQPVMDLTMLYADNLGKALNLLAAFAALGQSEQSLHMSVSTAQHVFTERLMDANFTAVVTVTDMLRGLPIPMMSPQCFANYSYIG